MEKRTKNIVFIGMPGSGKTTIGKLVASRINREFIDMDEYIVKREGCSISEIFSKGEDAFRCIETKVIEELSILSGVVISTGGGVVKNLVNMDKLSENSIIFFINRPVENIMKDIDINVRPLLKSNNKALYDIFDERYELYKKCCDIEINNNEDLEIVLDRITDIIVHQL